MKKGICSKCGIEKELKHSKRCSICVAKQRKEHSLINKEKIAIYDKERREKNRDKLNAQTRIWHKNNKEKLVAYKENRKLIQREWRRNYEKNRLKNDILYKLKSYSRTRIREFLKSKGFSKNTKTINILECDLKFFKLYLESLFQPGMTWENQGKWHIDHFIPLDIAITEKGILKLCHYTNLRPLWAKDNIIKGNKMPGLFLATKLMSFYQ